MTRRLTTAVACALLAGCAEEGSRGEAILRTALNAAQDVTLGAPACRITGNSCDTGVLIDGRGPLGPEPAQPNTLALSACADGTKGRYHGSESLDRLVVETIDGSELRPGATVRIRAHVWARPNASEDRLDLFFATDALNPAWTHLATLTPAAAGGQVLETTYTLPEGTLQAIRGAFRYRANSVVPCSTGDYDDHDDLVFSVADQTPPSIVLLTPGEGSTVTRPILFEASASDDRRLVRVEFEVDGQLVGSTTESAARLTWDARTFAAGSHQVMARALDATGNTSEVSRSFTLLDTRPNVTIVSPADGAILTAVEDVIAEASDDVGIDRVVFFVDDAEVWVDTTAPYVLPLAGWVGPHHVTVVAYDTIGQHTLVTTNVTLDLAAPQVDLFTPTGDTISRDLEFGAAATDDAFVVRLELLANGEVIWAGAEPASWRVLDTRVYANDTILVLEARAFDVAGRMSAAVKSFRVFNDDVPPVVEILEPTAGTTLSGYATIKVGASDNDRISWVHVDGLPPDEEAPYEFTFDARSRPEGLHMIRARASDALGNVSESEPVVVVIDNDYEPPMVAMTAPTNGGLVTPYVRLAADAQDASGIGRVEFLVNYQVVAAATEPPFEAYWDGTGQAFVEARARAVDIWGHESISDPIWFHVDGVAPTIAFGPADLPQVTSQVFAVPAVATDDRGVARVEVWVDGVKASEDVTAEDGFAPVIDPLDHGEGSHALTLRAVDLAGNSEQTAYPAYMTFSHDRSPPGVELTDPFAGRRVRGDVSVHGRFTDDRGIRYIQVRVDDVIVASLGAYGTTDGYWYLSFDSAAFAEGPHVLTVQAYDDGGNEGSATDTAYFVQDYDGPELTVVEPAPGTKLTGPAPFSVNASDPSGVQSIILSPTGGWSELCLEATFCTTTLAPEPRIYTMVVRVEAADRFGNTTHREFEVAVEIDLNAPMFIVESPSWSWRSSGVTEVILSVWDETTVASVGLYHDGVKLAERLAPPWTFSVDTTLFPDGPLPLTVVAADVHGNSVQGALSNFFVQNGDPAHPWELVTPRDDVRLYGSVNLRAQQVGDARPPGWSTLVFDSVQVAEVSEDGATTLEGTWDTSQQWIADGPYQVWTEFYADGAMAPSYSRPRTVHVVQAAVDQIAVHDATRGAPVCEPGGSCSSDALLAGRGPIGPELHAPNTLGGACGDGTQGLREVDPSIEAIEVRAAYASALVAHGQAQVVLAHYLTAGVDWVDLFHANDADAPDWRYVTSIAASRTGFWVDTVVLPLGGGEFQAFRAVARRGGAPVVCPGGPYDDVDDVVIRVFNPD